MPEPKSVLDRIEAAEKASTEAEADAMAAWERGDSVEGGRLTFLLSQLSDNRDTLLRNHASDLLAAARALLIAEEILAVLYADDSRPLIAIRAALAPLTRDSDV